MKPGLSSRRLRRLRGSSMPAWTRGVSSGQGLPGSLPCDDNRARQQLGLTSITALLPPQQVVFSQNAPVATCLRSSEQVTRLQKGEDVQRQLEKKGEPCPYWDHSNDSSSTFPCAAPSDSPLIHLQGFCNPEPAMRLLDKSLPGGQDRFPAACLVNNHNCSRAGAKRGQPLGRVASHIFPLATCPDGSRKCREDPSVPSGLITTGCVPQDPTC